MKLAIVTALILSFTIQSAFAGNAIKVHEGDVVKKEYDQGVLMDKEQSEKVRDELIDKDTLQKTNESLNKTVLLYRSNEDILSGQKDLLIKQNIELTKTLNDTRQTSDLLKVGYFVLGVAVTALAVHGAARLSK